MIDDDLSALRSQMCHLSADWLADAGDSLWVSAWVTQDDDVEAVALVTQMVGQLGQGPLVKLFDLHKRWSCQIIFTG